MKKVNEMGNCACDERCKDANLPESKHHACPGCMKPIHAICGVLDPNGGIKYSNWCYDCHDKAFPKDGDQKKMPATTTAFPKDDDPKKMPATTMAFPKDDGQKKMEPTTTNKKPSAETRKARPTKKLKIQAPVARSTDAFLQSHVAFPLDGSDKPEWLNREDCLPYSRTVGGRAYLMGLIIKKEKGTMYQIEWEHSGVTKTSVTGGALLDAVSLARSLKESIAREDENFPITNPLLNAMTAITDDHERGNPPADNEDEAEKEDFNIDDERENRGEGVLPRAQANHVLNLDAEDLILPSLMDNEVSESGDDDQVGAEGIFWKFNGKQNPPVNVSKGIKTQLKENTKTRFVTPLSSFLAFVPIEFWKLYVFRTNCQGKKHYIQRRDAAMNSFGVYRGKVWKNASLQEFMVFFGILIHMTTRPTPGQRYTDCWDNSGWHPYTCRMDRARFVEIRSALYMAEQKPKGHKSNDALFKLRPLTNVLKKTLGSYVVPGSELALDEASIASRTKYGRALICFNPSKPGGKYHFKLYVVTDTDCFVCLRFRIHMKNGSDVGDGLAARLEMEENPAASLRAADMDAADEHGDKSQGILVELVCDMLKPWYNTGKVVNMDNYYTSPKAFIELRRNGIFARGTCRGDRSLFPACIQFSPTEATKRGRGAMKVATNAKFSLTALGWVDGNPVHFLTSADGTEATSVRRRVGQDKITIQAPAAVRKYNHGMQGVDRFDQFVALFSLAKRHGFQKYYIKLAMGLLDFALTNAEIHYFMANPLQKKKGNHRLLFREELCNAIYETDWTNYSTSNSDFQAQFGIADAVQGGAPVAAEKEASTATPSRQANEGFKLAPSVKFSSPDRHGPADCVPIGIAAYLRRNNSIGKGRSYRGTYCQICTFEGRKMCTSHVVICDHGVRACAVSRTSENSAETEIAERASSANKGETDGWLCPNRTASCWDKMHHFYIPKGLFGTNPGMVQDEYGLPGTVSVRTSSEIYKAKQRWLVSVGLREKEASSGGRSRAKKKKEQSAAVVTEDAPAQQQDLRKKKKKRIIQRRRTTA